MNDEAVLRLAGVRLDPAVPEHRLVYEAYQRVPASGRAEWLRFHLVRSVVDMGSKLKEYQPVSASVPRPRRKSGPRLPKPAVMQTTVVGVQAVMDSEGAPPIPHFLKG